jgi:hypothetical protein
LAWRNIQCIKVPVTIINCHLTLLPWVLQSNILATILPS